VPKAIWLKEIGAMISRRAWIRGAVAVGTAGVAIQQLWRHGHDYVLPSQFVIVEPGKIYRGAWQRSWPMRRIVSDYKIKTIVALAHPPDHHLAIQERDLARELGVNWIHVPIIDNRGTSDREAAEGISDLLDRAAAVLADPSSYPVFFHCHHGLNRTSMVQIAYRTKYCGWTLTQAADEIERSVGLVKVNHGPDYRHMVDYYQTRVLPLRQKPVQAPDGAKAPLTAHVHDPAPASARRR
jgi:protein-tyrosine phosphatase